jgi:type IV pilus assembly protein PilB
LYGSKRTGEILIEFGYITEPQLEAGLEYQRKNDGRRIGEVLVELGFISEKQKIKALSKKHNLAAADIADISVDGSAVELIPRHIAEKYRILPVRRLGSILTVLTDDPMNLYGFDAVRQVSGMQIEIILSEKMNLMRAIESHYAEAGARQAVISANIHAGKLSEKLSLLPHEDNTPIVNLLNRLVIFAYTFNASDIHIEPFEDTTLVRMRQDGNIVDYMTLQKKLHSSLIARIKILSDLDIAERRLPQDGHARMNVNGTAVNIRVSLIPTVFGEKAVLRILDGNTAIDYSGTFGMRRPEYDKFINMLKSPNGLIYLTGPTGSGKTTTLYMVLEHLSAMNLNISTIEDPVEKSIRRVNQMQVNNSAGLTFETGLKALLRQDPDIIMVGETRDPITASISIRAAITGHLVLSTLHTSDACSSVIRLTDMGLEPYLLADSIIGIAAQRLMRKVCINCAAESATTDEEIRLLGAYVPKIKRAVGCHACNYTGYAGRIAIHEIMTVDSNLRRMIAGGASSDKIKEYTVNEQGMLTLKDAAVKNVADGLTTMEEYLKISYGD